MTKQNVKMKHEINMCEGPLLPKLLLFSIPLVISGILQLLFNAADMIVAGKFAGSTALGAVGSTSSLINLMINVFMGMSVGTNVLVAHYYGAKKAEELQDTVHTSIALSLVCGVILAFSGYFLSGPLLRLMGTPEEILPHAIVYMQIYFIGIPGLLLYNFGAAILQAIGDTKRPLWFLILAGIVNVILNLIFVICFQAGVTGVALATIISQFISAGLVLYCLVHDDAAYRLNLRKIALQKDKVQRIMRVGLPAGFQGAIFSISNVLIQSSVNTFGPIAVAGNTAACNLEGFVYNAMNSIHQTAISFTSQNMGANKPKRIGRIAAICLSLVTVIGVVLGGIELIFSHTLLSFYTNDPSVIAYGKTRLIYIVTLYFICGWMDVIVGVLRGMGYAIMPTVVSLIGACGLRVLWIFTVFASHRSLEVLYTSYPVSWAVTFAVHMVCFVILYRKLLQKSRKVSN